MDLVDRIETTRFLGGEFVLWLWFSQDVMEGLIELPKGGALELTLGSPLVLTDPLAPRESVTLRGLAPCLAPEARQALQQGKLPSKVGLRLVFEQSEWVLTLNASTLGASGVKLPALLSEGEEEHFYERMRLLEQMHDLVQALYARFLGIRLSPRWEAELAPALRRWVAEGHVGQGTARQRTDSPSESAPTPAKKPVKKPAKKLTEKASRRGSTSKPR